MLSLEWKLEDLKIGLISDLLKLIYIFKLSFSCAHISDMGKKSSPTDLASL